MFEKLFAESGLTLDRLRALLEVGAAGSIVKAAQNDPVRQSQYSRQIKELEDFFRIKLIERQGKGTRLTDQGRELARISRFFMLGLSNFQRGCVAEEQTYGIGCTASVATSLLVPAISSGARKGVLFRMERTTDEQAERRLHELTLDYAVVGRQALSRPLQTTKIGTWQLELWMPKLPGISANKAAKAFAEGTLPLACARGEMEALGIAAVTEARPVLLCDSFLEARESLECGHVAALLPDFMMKVNTGLSRINVGELPGGEHALFLAWNPRLLRLNPHAAGTRDWLIQALQKTLAR